MPPTPQQFEIALTPEILWWTFGVIVTLVVIVSAAFLFHWIRYSFGGKRIKWMGALYFLGVLVLFGAACAAMLSYINSLPGT